MFIKLKPCQVLGYLKKAYERMELCRCQGHPMICMCKNRVWPMFSCKLLRTFGHKHYALATLTPGKTQYQLLSGVRGRTSGWFLTGTENLAHTGI